MTFREMVRQIEANLQAWYGDRRWGLDADILADCRGWAILTLVNRRRWPAVVERFNFIDRANPYEDWWAGQWINAGHPEPCLWMYPDEYRDRRIERHRKEQVTA